MKTLSFTVCFALLFAHSALAANPIHSLHPDDTDALKPAGVDVSYSVIVNDEKNPEFAFTVSVEVPAGIDSLDAYFVVRNVAGEVHRQFHGREAGVERRPFRSAA